MEEPVFILAEAINALINKQAAELEMCSATTELLGLNAMNMVKSLYLDNLAAGDT